MTDSFPEAFERFTEDYPVQEGATWSDIFQDFRNWDPKSPRAGLTRLQRIALKREIRKLGIPTPKEPYMERVDRKVVKTRKGAYINYTLTRITIERDYHVSAVRIEQRTAKNGRNYNQYRSLITGKFISKPDWIKE